MRGAFGAGAVLALAAAFARPAAAVPTNTGGNTAEFLTLGAGARALGMGDAYGPVAEGPDAMYWNPAGLAALTQPEMSFTHSEMNTFFRHEYASYAHPVEALGGTMGGAATVWSMDPIQGLNYAGQQTGAFAPHSEAFSIGFAKSFWEHNDIPTRDREFFQDKWDFPNTPRPLHDKGDVLWEGSMRAGIALKGIFETIQNSSAKAVAMDAGFLFYPYQFEGLTLSMTLRNVGSHPVFNHQVESLPAEFDGGAAYDIRWPGHRIVLASEIGVPYYGDPYAKVGAEFGFAFAGGNEAFFRLGYDTVSAPYLGAVTGATVGVGLRVRSFASDIAFQPMGSMQNAIKMSLQWRFSTSASLPESKPAARRMLWDRNQ